MRERHVALLLLFAALLGGRAVAQVFPNDQAPRPAFPAAFTLFVFGAVQGDRVTRIYNVGLPPDPLDAACDSAAGDCRTVHGLAGAAGIGVRGQFPLSARSGIRVGVSASHPGRRVATRDGVLVAVPGEAVTLLRVDGLALFRLKPQVPVYFGFGGSIGFYSAGPVRNQDAVNEVGAAFAVGVDHYISPTVGTRVEFTGFVMKPTAKTLSAEYHAHALAFDGQLSFGFNFLVKK
jgi:hypothetical protein